MSRGVRSSGVEHWIRAARSAALREIKHVIVDFARRGAEP